MREVAAEGFAALAELHRQLNAVYHDMEEAKDEALDRLLHRQSDLERQIESSGGYVVDHKIDAVLHGLGFTDVQFTLGVEKLSGGQRLPSVPCLERSLSWLITP